MFGWKKKPRDTDPPLSEADRRDLQLSAYLDDDLSAAERDALESSLLAEPQVADALQGMRQITDTLASLETVRAPRSFAIEAPATPVSARSGFGRLELVARFGAVAAAVAFAAVLFGDVRGPTLTSTSSDMAAGGAAAERSTALSSAAQESAPLTVAAADTTSATDDSADDAMSGAGTGGAATDGAMQPAAAPADPNADPVGTSSALVASQTPTPAPSEATASLQTTATDGTAQPANTGGVGGATAENDAPTDSAGDASTDSTPAPDPVEEPGEASTPPDTAVEDLPNRTADADTESTGTDSQPPTLATQVQESFGGAAASRPSPTDEALSPFEADEDGISALATTLGAATAILASASVLLWWRRKRTTGPA